MSVNPLRFMLLLITYCKQAGLAEMESSNARCKTLQARLQWHNGARDMAQRCHRRKAITVSKIATTPLETQGFQSMLVHREREIHMHFALFQSNLDIG